MAGHRPRPLDGSYGLMIPGPGVAAGGQIGHVLKKVGEADYLTDWGWVLFSEIAGDPLTNSALASRFGEKANLSHSHDDRYYRKDQTYSATEVNGLLDGKSDVSHTHDYAASDHTHVQVVTLLVSDPNASSALTTGDGKIYWRVPSTLNGWNLTGATGAVTTVSSSGPVTVQVHNLTDAVDMLSTPITVDVGETDGSSAVAAVIDATKDDVATADMLRVDVDAAGTGVKGLIIELQFTKP